MVDSQYSLITASQMYEAPGPGLSSEPEYDYATAGATTPSGLNKVTTSQMYEAPGPGLPSEPEYHYATAGATTPSGLNQVTA